ncbi:hypothetical protein HYPSUDRAFT_529947 [Hypholoma sublateritium FD-334 SS-4]|uniref:Uncharacterized protein n=1 Tax=Hypholoma sublateritium (strain FD-334 SS-4) TaxID=945553 RepID=A0A0D2KGT5_HYPSF|nr:hypothetical protein HYPSUDRAFT_529947 [Hypholoma sublateritium FD-334 SS-4]
MHRRYLIDDTVIAVFFHGNLKKPCSSYLPESFHIANPLPSILKLWTSYLNIRRLTNRLPSSLSNPFRCLFTPIILLPALHSNFVECSLKPNQPKRPKHLSLLLNFWSLHHFAGETHDAKLKPFQRFLFCGVNMWKTAACPSHNLFTDGTFRQLCPIRFSGACRDCKLRRPSTYSYLVAEFDVEGIPHEGNKLLSAERTQTSCRTTAMSSLEGHLEYFFYYFCQISSGD